MGQHYSWEAAGVATEELVPPVPLCLAPAGGVYSTLVRRQMARASSLASLALSRGRGSSSALEEL